VNWSHNASGWRAVSQHSTTKERVKTEKEDAEDFNPQQDENAEVELFIGATIGNQNEGTIYTDQRGNFPGRLYHGKQCIFVAYEYRSNQFW